MKQKNPVPSLDYIEHLATKQLGAQVDAIVEVAKIQEGGAALEVLRLVGDFSANAAQWCLVLLKCREERRQHPMAEDDDYKARESAIREQYKQSRAGETP